MFSLYSNPVATFRWGMAIVIVATISAAALCWSLYAAGLQLWPVIFFTTLAALWTSTLIANLFESPQKTDLMKMLATATAILCVSICMVTASYLSETYLQPDLMKNQTVADFAHFVSDEDNLNIAMGLAGALSVATLTVQIWEWLAKKVWPSSAKNTIP